MFFVRQLQEIKFAIRQKIPGLFSSSFRESSSLFQNILLLLYTILSLLQFLMKPLVLKITFRSRDHAAMNLLIFTKWCRFEKLNHYYFV